MSPYLKKLELCIQKEEDLKTLQTMFPPTVIETIFEQFLKHNNFQKTKNIQPFFDTLRKNYKGHCILEDYIKLSPDTQIIEQAKFYKILFDIYKQSIQTNISHFTLQPQTEQEIDYLLQDIDSLINNISKTDKDSLTDQSQKNNSCHLKPDAVNVPHEKVKNIKFLYYIFIRLTRIAPIFCMEADKKINAIQVQFPQTNTYTK